VLSAIYIEVKNDLTEVYKVVGLRQSNLSWRACQASRAEGASEMICEIDISTMEVRKSCAVIFRISHFCSSVGSEGAVSVLLTTFQRERDRR